jgi:hypothetical protein
MRERIAMWTLAVRKCMLKGGRVWGIAKTGLLAQVEDKGHLIQGKS